jgi:hypothetical protein
MMGTGITIPEISNTRGFHFIRSRAQGMIYSKKSFKPSIPNTLIGSNFTLGTGLVTTVKQIQLLRERNI